MKIAAAVIAIALASTVQAAPLTVRPGESWLFTIKDGDPVNAHKVRATAKPAKGQIMVTVRTLFGTAMVLNNNSRTSYVLNAELLEGGKVATARTCTLPGGAKPTLEQWDQKAEAVRIGNFRASGKDGRC